MIIERPLCSSEDSMLMSVLFPNKFGQRKVIVFVNTMRWTLFAIKEVDATISNQRIG